MKRMSPLSQLSHLLGAMCSGRRQTERGADLAPQLGSPRHQAHLPAQLQLLFMAVSQSSFLGTRGTSRSYLPFPLPSSGFHTPESLCGLSS